MKLKQVLCGAFVAAMANTAIAAEPAPVIDISSKSSSRSSSTMNEELAQLKRKQEASNRRQVALQRQLDELLQEVDELRGVTELHTHQLSQVLERQRELYQELDKRVSQALKPETQVPAAIVAPGNQSGYSADLSENQAYDRAVNLVLKEKQYDKAIPEFESFIQKFPQSSYAPNAHYWLGQLLFNKGRFAEAKVQFNIVAEQFKTSTKRSDAMLKLALVEQRQNNNAAAKAIYQKLINEYPTSSAAKLAKTRLDSLN